MAKETNQTNLGNEGIKVILFRTVPGHEKDVVQTLKSHLSTEMKKPEPSIMEYQIYKILGLYDIMVIYQCKEFLNDLLFKGTLAHVIHSNEILCFPLLKQKVEQFILKDNLKTGIAISLLKLRTEVLLEFGLDIESAVAHHMESQGNLIVLGGLGWSEFLMIYPHTFDSDELSYIFNDLVGMASLYYTDPIKETNIPIVKKTYSLIGVSYEVIGNLRKTFPSEFDASKKIACPRLLMSAPGPNLNLVNTAFSSSFKKSEKGFDYDPPQIVMGVNDISINFKKGKWGDFLDSLIKFRRNHTDMLLDTRIEVSIPFRDENNYPEFEAIKKPQFPAFFLGEKETEKISQRRGTSHIIATLYKFGNFFHNPLFRDSFIDLYFPANELINKTIGKTASGEWKVEDKKLSEYLRQFQYALRERAMGAYLFTEEDEHLFSPIKGGLQKLLLALASIPFSLLSVLFKDESAPWRGFVSIGLRNEPMHFYENLLIPFDHALYPDRHWWCLIHEVGHILCLKYKILSQEHDNVSQVIARLPANRGRTTEQSFNNIADNCFADIFDFLIGFLRKRSLYFKVCWKFLLSYAEGQKSPIDDLQSHLTRQFVGWIYEKKFLRMQKALVSLDNFGNIKKEARKFIIKLQDIPAVNQAFSKYEFDSDDFNEQLATDSMPLIHLLEHFSGYLTPIVELSTKLEKTYKSKEFVELVRKLEENGDILNPSSIEFPHLIPLKLMENAIKKERDDISNFRTNIATIHSLYWYSYANQIPAVLGSSIKSR